MKDPLYRKFSNIILKYIINILIYYKAELIIVYYAIF